MANPPARYSKSRIFVKGVESQTYSLTEARRHRLATVPRVIRREVSSDKVGSAEEKNILSPQAEPFVTQSLHAHYVTLAPGARDKGHGHQNEEFVYILKGRGFDMHWEVEVEITDRYHARPAKEPSRWGWKAGDLVYIPHNTIHQHFNGDPSSPVQLIVATNRLYKMIGYSRVEQLENAPDFDGRS